MAHIFNSKRNPVHRRNGSVLLMTLMYTVMFGALASAMVAFAMGNMSIGRAETQNNRALSAAETGMAFALTQLRVIGLPVITEGSIAKMSDPTLIWYGKKIENLTGSGNNTNNNGIGVQLASAINNCGAFVTSGSTVAIPTSLTPLVTPAIAVDPTNDDSNFQLTVAWNSAKTSLDSSKPVSWIVLTITSVGKSGQVSRTVSMDVTIQKTLKYAVYSNVAIQVGKNVRVVGDIASAYNGTSKGPPVQMFSDFHHLPNQSATDSDLGDLRTLLAKFEDPKYPTNRLDVRNPSSAAAVDAKKVGLVDRNGDGYIDDYDVALLHLDSNFNASNPTGSNITSGEFTNPNTGLAYDADLWTLLDSPLGGLDPNNSTLLLNGMNKPWAGYGDNQTDNLDSYAKVNGTVKMAITQAQWAAAASGWEAWGDNSGTRFQDLFEGPVVSPDPTVKPVQFGVNFSNELTMTPQSFDTSALDANIPASTATVVTSGTSKTISNGTLTAAMANGTTTTERFPPGVSSGWQATYTRPVFQNVNFNNVRIPKGLNAKFINCTFNGYTSVKLTTTVKSGGTVGSTGSVSGGTTTYDPSAGMTWAKLMIPGKGSFSADTALTASNSVAFTQGNNLRFTGCTFTGPLSADVPTAYTHFANSMTFDGNTNISNTTDTSVTIEAPNTNIEMGSYQAPGDNPSTLVGVVVAGNIDIRGSASVDGSLIVTGNGASNTTLGYFGTTDSGQAVPSLSQLPGVANGSYGHLFFRYNPGRGMPNGIKIPVSYTPQYSTYCIK